MLGLITKLLDKSGALGSLVAAMGCAACFPALASIGAAPGLGFLAMNEIQNLERFQPVLELMGELTGEQSRIALAIYRAIAERGTFTPSELASITGKTEGEIEDHMNETANEIRGQFSRLHARSRGRYSTPIHRVAAFS